MIVKLAGGLARSTASGLMPFTLGTGRVSVIGEREGPDQTVSGVPVLHIDLGLHRRPPCRLLENGTVSVVVPVSVVATACASSAGRRA